MMATEGKRRLRRVWNNLKLKHPVQFDDDCEWLDDVYGSEVVQLDEDHFSGLFVPLEKCDIDSEFLRVNEVSFNNEDHVMFNVQVIFFGQMERGFEGDTTWPAPGLEEITALLQRAAQ